MVPENNIELVITKTHFKANNNAYRMNTNKGMEIKSENNNQETTYSQKPVVHKIKFGSCKWFYISETKIT